VKKPCTMLATCEAKEHRSSLCPAYGKKKPIKKKGDGLDGLRELLP
jgi:hypothetical protein